MGNRVTTISDVLTVKIGGDAYDKKIKRPDNRIESTKYTLITFLPQNFLEQFRRIANFYFLFMTIIAIVIDSPVNPLTSLIPLIFVIAVTAAKQGYEDYLRHKADSMVNYSYVTVIRNGTEVDIKCQDILQGDLVKSVRDCDVPCDIVILKSSDSNGKCHITTANLDGETNLKTLTVPRGLPNVSVDKLHTLGVIECEQPRTDLYSFTGRLELGAMYKNERQSLILNPSSEKTHALPLMTENLLLRGSRIKNTDWAIGCAVYTGQNTKLSLNSRLTRNKMSSSEKFINKFLVFFLTLLISIVTISYFLKRKLRNERCFRFYDLTATEHKIYIGEPKVANQISTFLQDYFSFLVLFNYLIPISLYVTIEMHKFLGALFLEWDIELYDAETNQTFIVNTSDLNEELGQVQILFSDKTGTLTKNEMILQEISIMGKKYKLKSTGIQQENRPNVMKIWEFREDVFNFFQTLSACHTVQVAGDISNTAEGDENSKEEVLQNVTSFTNITEENENSAPLDSDLDEVDFISKQKIKDINIISNGMQLGDFSPLLFHKSNNDFGVNIVGSSLMPNSSNKHSATSTNDSKSIVSGKLFVNSKFNLQRPASLIDYPSSFSPKLSPLNLRKNQLSRPLSIELKRTISVALESEKQDHMTHRRTQSYGATTDKRKYSNASGSRSPRNFLRQSGSFANLREYYAAPSFNEASLLERKESMRRKKEIDTVIENLDYQASSPDEKALVEACAKIGFIFTGEENDHMIIKLQNYNRTYIKQSAGGREFRFKRLNVLEFTSDRKRMSIIVRDNTAQIWLLTKGAESHVLPLCQASNSALLAETQAHINDFAKIGFRTLAVARKKLTEEEYANYENDILEAGSSLTNRNRLIEEVQAKLENNLELLGATAVEDALQDNVRDTLESLKYAGIKVWVLTGDKIETALNIALSCGHISHNAYRYFITECREDVQLVEHLNVLEKEIDKAPNAEFSLLIDGASLAIALKNHSDRFRDMAIKCSAVLCCRLSPLQKCEVVHLIRTSKEKPITAAIGDGANDVSMIQEAHVGLGIVGKEGRQAARCADYAFANFSMLKRVLLVHGHYFSQRLALLVLYFFYKNLVFMLIQLFFQTNTLFSSQSVYDSVFLTLYNVFFTSMPVLVISLTEKTYSMDHLMKCPELYKENYRNKRLTWKYFIGWMILGCYHGTVIYVSGYIIWRDNSAIFGTPYTANFWCFGTFMIHNVVVLVNLRLWLEAKYQTYWFLCFTFGSILVFMLTSVVYNMFVINFDGDMLYVYNNLLSSISFWLLSVMITIAALIPDFTMKTCKILSIKMKNIFPGPGEFSKKIHPESTYL